jgi:lipopolysaccharide export system protein LptA
MISAITSRVLAQSEAKNAQSILPGGNSKQPVNIEADKLDYFDKDQKLIYEGNVVATQGDSRLKASRLIIFLAPKSKTGTNEESTSSGSQATARDMRRMEAAGPVTLISKDQVGTGENGVYDKNESKVYLNGNVTLSQNGNVTKGDRLIYDLKTSQAFVTGHVRSMFLTNGPSDSMSVKKPQTGTALPQSPAKSQ